jgi:phosphohistidine phosphatase
MELYFFRHGDAEEAGPGQSDYERRLTDAGVEETRRVAEALRRAGIKPNRIVSTSLVRAQQTAAILREVVGSDAPIEGSLSAGTQVGEIQRTMVGGGRRFFIVGHAPYMGQIVGQLIAAPEVDLAKSGCARVDTRRVEPGEGKLIWLITPELFG